MQTENKTATQKRVLYEEFKILLAICLLFAASAFVFDRPVDIIAGLGRIFTSRGLLRTDYMITGGIGAALLNASLVGLYSLALIYFSGAKPAGGTLMSFWMGIGWSCWGMNVFSIFPLSLGVWLYARLKKQPFSNFMVAAILAGTIAPIVSCFYFTNPIMLHLGASWSLPVNILCGVVIGIICGFLLPIISAAATRMHDGYTLFNMGVTGGMIATFLAAILKAFGVEVSGGSDWYTGSNGPLAVFLFVISGVVLLTGVFLGSKRRTNHSANFKKMYAESGHAPNDFYTNYGPTAYINMGLMGMFGTTVVLALKADLNGATFACIFSMVAFGGLGEHLKNVIPTVAGAIICAYLNTTGLTAPGNILPILFSACLAPIGGQFGFGWGMVTGFMHVLTILHIGGLTSGFNIYNNGFASGFVAFFLVPIIVALKKEKA